MTSDKNIIKGLKQLYKTIKPDSAWVEKNRAKLLAYFKDNFPSQRKDLFFYFKPVFVTIVALFVFVASSGGLVVYAKKSTPGDILYSFKRLTEKVVYQLTPTNQKPVLRAEMVGERLGEVKTLAEKFGSGNLENQLSLEEATLGLKKEIVALKKEISPETQTKIIPRGDLPILDNRKIVEAVTKKDFDLNKFLAATKEAIRGNNFSAALVEINKVEKIFTEAETEAGEKKQVPENTQPVTEPKEIQLKPAPIQGEKTLPAVETKPANSDFSIEIEKEAKESFEAESIKE